MSDRMRDLRWFVAVIEAGGFSRAAQRLGVPQSAVSRAVQGLEESFGASLLTRTTRRVAPTEAGSALHERAAHLLRYMEETEEIVSNRQILPRGLVRLSLPVNYGRHKVLPTLPALIARYPELELEVHFQDRSVDLLEDRVDVAVRVGSEATAGTVSSALGATVRRIVASPDWIARHGAPSTEAELAERPFVRFRRGDEPPALWLGGPGGPRRLVVGGPASLADLDAVMALALAGVGAAQLPCFLVERAMAAGALLPIATALWPAATPVRVLWREGSRPARVRAVVDHLRAAAQLP